MQEHGTRSEGTEALTPRRPRRTVRVNADHRITLPRDLLAEAGIEAGGRVRVDIVGDAMILRRL